jgi:hypothetical protein
MPIVLTTWNKDDEVLVQLVKHKIAWGEAVMRLKANRTEMLFKVTDQTSRSIAELNRSKQAELDRRAGILDSFLGLVP